MKKLTAMILTALLLLSLCACNGGKRATTGSDLTWEEVERIADRQHAEEGKKSKEIKSGPCPRPRRLHNDGAGCLSSRIFRFWGGNL